MPRKAQKSPPVRKTSISEPKAIKHIDDGQDRSLSSREKHRQQLQADIEKFLQRGGTVKTVAPRTLSDPPKKPNTSYGSRPI